MNEWINEWMKGGDEEAGRPGEADPVRRQGTWLGTLHVHRPESPRRELHVRQPHRQRYPPLAAYRHRMIPYNSCIVEHCILGGRRNRK